MVSIRSATLADRGEICWLHKLSIRRECATHYPPDQVQRWADFLAPEHYTPVISDPSRHFLVAELDGRIVGFGQLNPVAAEVEAVYVHPDSVRAGIGSAIMAHLEALACEASLPSLRLSATLNAVPFYQRHGFRVTGHSNHQHPSGAVLQCAAMTKAIGSAMKDSAVAGSRGALPTAGQRGTTREAHDNSRQMAQAPARVAAGKLARVLLLTGCALAVATALFHASGYPSVVRSIQGSGAQPFLVSAVKALWLMFSIHLVLVAAAVAVAAFTRGSARLVVFLALLPAADTVLLAIHAGAFIGTFCLAAVALLFVAGALLFRRDEDR